MTTDPNKMPEVPAQAPTAVTAAPDERARITAILDGPTAAGREALARHRAFDTDMTPEAAAAVLGSAPKAAQRGRLAAEMAKVPVPNVGPGGPEPDKDVSISQIAAQIVGARR